MEQKKLFRTALFGFNKQDVYSYLDEYLHDGEAKLAKKDQEIMELIEINKKINEDYSALRGKLDTYETERDKISGIIVQSQLIGESIIDRAQKNAKARLAEVEGKIEFETAKLQALRDEMGKLLTIANQTTSYMKTELETVHTLEADTDGK